MSEEQIDRIYEKLDAIEKGLDQRLRTLELWQAYQTGRLTALAVFFGFIGTLVLTAGGLVLKHAKLFSAMLAAGYIIILMTGCTCVKSGSQSSSTAYVAAHTARLQVAKARVAVERIKAAMAEPAKAAQMAEIQTELDKADEALIDAGSQIETLQHQMDETAKARSSAEEREREAENRGRFWRAWTLRLAGLCLAFGLWMFRKPLLVIAGL